MGGFPDPAQISLKPAGKLDRADRDQFRILVDQRSEFIQIDLTVSLRAKPQLNAKLIPDPPPGVEVGGEFARELNNVIAGIPFEPGRDRREPVRGVSHERDLLRPDVQHQGEQIAAAVLRCDPVCVVFRTVI